jgi:hypothetical protein
MMGTGFSCWWAGFCERGAEHSGSIKGREFFTSFVTISFLLGLLSM